MADKLLTFMLQLSLGLLDKWLDLRIEQAGWDVTTKARAQMLEDELIRFLEGPLGLAIAKAFGKAIMAERFGNDPTTGNWG